MESLAGRYLIFELGGQDWAVDIRAVRDLVAPLPVTCVPQSPEHVLGAFNLRGRVLPLLDPRQPLGLPPGRPEQGVFVVLSREREEGETLFAVLVDKVHEVLSLPPEQCSPPPELPGGPSDLLEGVGREEERLLFIVDLGRLLAA